MPDYSRDAESFPGRIALTAKGQAAELLIYGDIGYSGLGVDAKQVVEQIASLQVSTINVRINSYGGIVSDGVAIYSALKRHPAKINVTIDGVAASIASQIAMAGDVVEMPVNALLMIHAPWGGLAVQGNAMDVRRAADSFITSTEAFASAMAEGYAAKSGRSVAEMLELVSDGEDHWYTAREAHAAGFCDVVVEDASKAAATALEVQRIVAATDFTRFRSRMPGRLAAMLATPTNNDGARRPEDQMPETNTSAVPAPAVALADRNAIVAAERDRVEQIRGMGAPHLAYIGNLAETAIAKGWTPEHFGQLVLAKLGEGRESLGGYAGGESAGYGSGRPGGSDFLAAASDVLAQRAGVLIDKPHAAARDCAQMSLVDIARACLPRSDRETHGSAHAVIRAALSTSDFPHILENAMYKAVRRGYEDEPGTHSAWVFSTTVPDFKLQSRVLLGSMPELQLVPEGAEYQLGSIDEDKSVPFKVEKYGVSIPITFEALVNDDLSALGRIPVGLGMSARRKEADLVYSLLAGNGQLMQDGNALFHASHRNLAETAADLDEASLAAGRLLLRKQTAFGGGQLNLAPRFLLVPPELESKAEKLIAASSVYVSAGLESNTAQWIRSLTLVVENRLPPDAFYLATSPSQVDTIELAYLDDDVNFGSGARITHQSSSRGPVVEHVDEFNRDVRIYKVRSTMGARVLDWRGLVKTPISA